MIVAVQKFTPYMLSVLRVVTGLLFLEHGTSKFLGFPGGKPIFTHFFTLPWFSGFLEFFGGALILIGLFTQPVAFILAGEMAFAYFIAHAPRSFFPLLSGGEPAILYCFLFLFLFVAGGGAWSFDRKIWKH